jgi:nitric oxide dioxygenase
MFATRRLAFTRVAARSLSIKALTEGQTNIIKATVPILETGGETLTKHFYNVMLSEHPNVVPFFNKAHQASGDQPRALANAVLKYAKNIDKLQNLGPLVNQIIHKHVSLNILPAHYSVVGACLLRAIREVLGPEVATDAVIDAWGAAYGQLADILIGAEKGLMDERAAAAGGWRGSRQFVVKDKKSESSEITSFLLEPVDQKAVMAHQAGQYLGLHLNVKGDEVRRNYSISSAADGKSYRISVKKEANGVVSNHMHDDVHIGSHLHVYPPSGEFTLKKASDHAKPLVFLTAGVGITPAMAMLHETVGNPATSHRPMHFIHCARTQQEQAFRDAVAEVAAKHPNVVQHNHYSREGPNATRLNEQHLAKLLPAHRDVEVFLLGTKPFMSGMKKALINLGVPATQVHWEFFGPAADIDN